jgi:glycosyltransferase involved in cell wall biosynthesis
MPRVVRIIARLNVGGPAIHAVLATAGVDRTRFPTTLVTGRPGPAEGDMSYLTREHDVETVEIDELGREISVFDDVRALAKLVRLLREAQPEIVHTHTAKAGTLGRVAAILARVPVRVHTFHGHVFDGYFPPWKSQIFLWIERILAHFTHRILTVSEGQARELAGRFRVAGADRFAVVPLGLDLRPFASAEVHRGRLRAELGLPESASTVGIVGRMVPVKQHDLFLESCAELARRYPGRDLRFLLVGGGELERELRAKAGALGLADRAYFLGWRRDLPRIYADLDALALTSRNEGTPVALIEAMAAGVPVAATSVGGVPDLLDRGARGELVAAPATPASVAEAVDRALSPVARERAATLRRQIQDQYSAERLCRDLENLYTDLLTKGH